jgi:esterase/lipase superfamily enzyme
VRLSAAIRFVPAFVPAFVLTFVPALVVSAAACCLAPSAAAAPVADGAIAASIAASDCPAGDDDVWLVSTRRLPDIACLPAHVGFGVERLAGAAGASRWQPSDLESLLDSPGRPLVIFIHGNRYDSASAKSQGLLLARGSRACQPGGPPVRTVIFSWPSSQEGRLLRDSRSKYERTMSEGRYLAWFLGRVPPEQPVAIISYSYGGLIALEALDCLVGAERSGRSDLTPWLDRPARLHLVLVAAAVRQDALAPGGAFRRVIPCIDRLTLLNNSSDHALRFFRFIDPGLRTEALGHENMPARWLPRDVEFVQVDAAPIVGKSHRFPLYLESAALRARIASGALEGLSVD